eukprot:13780165-Alexandrium_andersonii.AAC.1
MAHVECAVKLYQSQLARGARALHARPATAASWGLPEMQKLLNDSRVDTAVGHMCCFGMRVSEPARAGVGGPLVRKPTRWA